MPPPNLPTCLPQSFRPGQRARARVLGFRPMDGLAVLSLKPSVVEQHILSTAGGCLVWLGRAGRDGMGGTGDAGSGDEQMGGLQVSQHLGQHLLLHLVTMFPAPPRADLRPGMAVTATVNRVEEYGLLVSVTSSIRCGGCQGGLPSRHGYASSAAASCVQLRGAIVACTAAAG